MGKGLTLQFKRLYPEMYLKYKECCQQGLLIPDKLWLWKGNGLTKDVLCFPTKLGWWKPSTEEYINLGLEKFVSTYKNKNIKSIAFPLLDAGCGQLDKDLVLGLIRYWVGKCDGCNIEICIL